MRYRLPLLKGLFITALVAGPAAVFCLRHYQKSLAALCIAAAMTVIYIIAAIRLHSGIIKGALAGAFATLAIDTPPHVQIWVIIISTLFWALVGFVISKATPKINRRPMRL